MNEVAKNVDSFLRKLEKRKVILHMLNITKTGSTVHFDTSSWQEYKITIEPEFERKETGWVDIYYKPPYAPENVPENFKHLDFRKSISCKMECYSLIYDREDINFKEIRQKLSSKLNRQRYWYFFSQNNNIESAILYSFPLLILLYLFLFMSADESAFIFLGVVFGGTALIAFITLIYGLIKAFILYKEELNDPDIIVPSTILGRKKKIEKLLKDKISTFPEYYLVDNVYSNGDYISKEGNSKMKRYDFKTLEKLLTNKGYYIDIVK